MDLRSIIDNLRTDSLASLQGFLPELMLCGTIVAMLLARMPARGHRLHAAWIALPGLLAAFYFAAPWNTVFKPTELFTGLLVLDGLTVFFRSVLIGFAILFVLFTWLSGIPDREDSPDFYALVLGATLGMCLMSSANHLFMVFLGVEMASVPSYALAGMLKGRRTSSEAALKYSVYGAGTAGVMLYGISLLAGGLGSLHLPTIVHQLAGMSAETLAERQTILVMGGLMLMVGLAFKLSAVPFHFWCPDVFEGASAEVNAFLSVASKAAALALLVRVALGFSHAPAASQVAVDDEPRTVLVAAADAPQPEKHAAAAPGGKQAVEPVAPHAASSTLGKARHYVSGLIALLAAITCTFGNLTAYAQTNIKRLLAYSTIAHAGYMMMPVAAAVTTAGDDPELARQSVAAVCFYVGTYLFMNLGAFAIVAFLRNAMHSEEVADYAGLLRRAPGIVICFSLVLISLLGLPPMAGFAAKFLAFAPLAAQPTKYPLLFTLLVVGGVNTVISLFYYLRLVKVMTLDPEPADRLPLDFSLVSLEGVYVVLVTAPVLLLGLGWDALHRWAAAAASTLLS